MARYWVGGTGSWSDTSHWSDTSGGASGFAVPTSADDVFFDTNSAGADYTVTLDATTKICRDFTATAPASGNLTLTDGGTNRVVQVYGSVSFYSGMVFSLHSNGATYFQMMGGGTNTIDSNGAIATNLQLYFFGGTGSASWTFADNWTGSYISGNLNGTTLNLNGKTFTLSATFQFTTGTGTITFGACTIVSDWVTLAPTVTLTDPGSIVSWTFSRAFDGGGRTFGGTVILSTVAYHYAYLGYSGTVDTFTNLTIGGTASTAMETILNANVIVTGTLTITGNSTINRNLIRSGTIGTARTITAATVSMSNVDLQDITGAGAGSWDLSAITGLSGDCGGNSGITFTPAADQYWVGGTGNWSAVAEWASTSGGAGSSGRVPLPQDTARFDANSFSAGSQTVTQDMPRIGSVDWTGATNTPTWTTSTTASVFGSITLIAGMTLTASSQAYTFQGRGSHTLTTAGKTWTKDLNFVCETGTYTLQDALATTNVRLTSGTFDANDFNVTVSVFIFSADVTRTASPVLYMRSGTFTTSQYGMPSWWVILADSVIHCGTSTIRLTATHLETVASTFTGGGKTYYNLEIATSSIYADTISGSNTFNNITIDAGRSVRFTAGTTQTVANFTAIGTAASPITIGSTTTSAFTLTKAAGAGAIQVRFCTISYSTGSANAWVASMSTDGGNNTNWTFPTTRYWVGGSGNWSDNTNHWSATSGGAPGASLPSATDDVVFDTNSHTTNYTVTIDAVTKTCRSIFWAAPSSGNVTWAGSVAMTISGSIIFYAGLVRTYTGAITFNSTFIGNAINTTGVSVASSFTFNGINGTWDLLSAVSGITTFTVTNGTLTTNNYSISAVNTNFAAAATVNPGTSTFTFTSAGVTVACSGDFSACTLNITGGATFAGNGKTFGNVSQQGAITGNNTFTNLTWAGSIGAWYSIADNQTVTGTLTLSSGGRYASSTFGTPKTITAGTLAITGSTGFGIHFRDIVGAGTANWDLSARADGGAGDYGGNSGITFSPAITCYWATNTGNWMTPSKWKTTSGGATTARIPLPQDTAIFDANSFTLAGQTVTSSGSGYIITPGNFDWTGVTNSPTWNMQYTHQFYGSAIVTSGVTITSTLGMGYTLELLSRSSVDIQSGGNTWPMAFELKGGGSCTLLDAFTSSYKLTVTFGTFDANDFNVTVFWFQSWNTILTRVVTMGSGIWTITGAGTNYPWDVLAPGLTINAETSTIRLTYTMTAASNFGGAGFTYYNLENATSGAYALQIRNSNSFNNIHIDASAAARTILFTAGSTTTVTTFTRDAGTNIITLGSITSASHTLTKVGDGTIILEYMDISYSTANPSRTWHAPNSTNSGNNIRWLFKYPSTGLAGMMLRAGGVLTY